MDKDLRRDQGEMMEQVESLYRDVMAAIQRGEYAVAVQQMQCAVDCLEVCGFVTCKLHSLMCAELAELKVQRLKREPTFRGFLARMGVK